MLWNPTYSPFGKNWRSVFLVAQGLTAVWMQGLNEWRNIQDIVRLTFKAFHDELKAQGDAIKGLERAVDAKSNRREVANALAAKADAAQLCEQMHSLETMLTRKADKSVSTAHDYTCC